MRGRGKRRAEHAATLRMTGKVAIQSQGRVSATRSNFRDLSQSLGPKSFAKGRNGDRRCSRVAVCYVHFSCKPPLGLLRLTSRATQILSSRFASLSDQAILFTFGIYFELCYQVKVWRNRGVFWPKWRGSFGRNRGFLDPPQNPRKFRRFRLRQMCRQLRAFYRQFRR